MGWLFTRGQTRADLIQRLTKPEESDKSSYRTLAHCCKGNVLWAVQEVTFKQSNPRFEAGVPHAFIACYLMGYDRAPDCRGWGYKDMEESMHPYHYHCPLAYLDMAPEACPAWREEVRKQHARNNRRIAVGECWALVGCTVAAVCITSVRPLRGRDYNGTLYRLKRRLLGEKLEADLAAKPVQPSLSFTPEAVTA